jgi:hypothetical protein
MNTVTDSRAMNTVSDGLTVSMVEVDAAAARAALADRLQLAQVDLEHPAVVAVLAAVVAAGWRPPVSSGGSGIPTHQVDAVPPLSLFSGFDGVAAPEWAAPPGRPR